MMRAPKRGRTDGARRRGVGAPGTAAGVVLALLATLVATPIALAEFASGGSGSAPGSIDWFEWGAVGEDLPLAGKVVTNTRTIGGVSLATTCTVGAVSGSQLEVYRPGDSPADGLDDLYNSGTTGPGNDVLTGLANVVDGGASTFPVSCSATLGGAAIAIAGLVVASAETNTGADLIRATTTTGQWRLLDRHRGAGCTENPIIGRDTPGAGELRLTMHGAGTCDTAPTAVALAEGAADAVIEIHGTARTAVAIGVMLFTDFSDAPAGYGAAGAVFIPGFSGPALVDGDLPLFDLGLSSVVAPTSSILGSAVSSESEPRPGPAASLDDGDDALTSGTSFDADPGAIATRSVSCTGSSFIAGWIDWDRNGAFDADEATPTTTCAAGTATLSWTIPSDATAGSSFMRLRSGRTSPSVASPIGVTGRGEVEDYAVSLMGAVPYVTCTTDPEIFNTGYDAATGQVLADGAADARWTVAGGAAGFYGPSGTTPPASTSLPPGGATWLPAEVGKINPAWSDSPYPTANYVSADYVVGTNQATPQADWYFRYQFDLDPMVDLTSFRLDMRWLADNSVAGIWVNDVPQTGTNLPQDVSNPYHYQGFLLANAAETRLEHDWHAGLNTIIVQMKSSNLAEGFLAFVDSTAVCIEPKSLTIDKVTDAADVPADGGIVTYTVTVTNSGPGAYTVDEPATMTDDLSDVLDDATFGAIIAPLSGASYAGGVVSWSGPLAAGESIDIIYTVVYDADGGGDHVLLNTACVPIDEAPSKPEACDSTQTPAAALEIEKTVDPADGTSVDPGDVLTYTLSFRNVGASPAVLNARDDLSGLLDDADLGPIVADPGITVVLDGTELEITGTVPASPVALTVTYTATVRAFTDQGDHVVTNLLLCPAGAPDSCAAIETQNPIPHLVAAKTTDRADGSTVYAGSRVEYTLTFTNDGAAPDSIHAVDDLSDVLDDADLVFGPQVDVPHQPVISVLQIAEELLIVGTLEAGGTATVTYAVSVRAAGERGDDLLRNVLTMDDPISTEHPVGDLVVGKSVADADAVALGDEVVWTVSAEVPDETVTAFVVVDDLDPRLDYVSTSVSLDGAGCPALGGSEIDVESPGVGDTGTVTVAFTDPVGLDVLSANPDCVVRVTITTRANAIGEIPNAARIYPNQGSIDLDLPLLTSPAETRWGAFTLQKLDPDGDPLVGARFSIHPDLSSAQSGTGAIELGGQSVFEVTDPSGELTLSGLRHSDFADGAAVGPGDPGYRTYYLLEVRAPDGHELLAQPVPVTIDAATTAVGVDVLVEDAASNAGFALPPTGGTAIASWLTGVGIIGMLGALLVLGWAGRRRLVRR